MTDVTQIICRIEQGDPTASEQLLPLVYDELRKLAAAKLANEQPGQTLQATALVHDAYLRLVDDKQGQHWNSRGHFFGAAAEAMRRILVENARRKKTQKLGGDRKRMTLEEADLALLAAPEKLLAIDDILDQLSLEAPDIGELVKLRIFVGMTVSEAATALNLSRTTAFRHWTFARAWLRARLSDDT